MNPAGNTLRCIPLGHMITNKKPPTGGLFLLSRIVYLKIMAAARIAGAA